MPVVLDSYQTMYRDAMKLFNNQPKPNAARLRSLLRLRAVDYAISTHVCAALDDKERRKKIREAMCVKYNDMQAKFSSESAEEERALNTFLIQQLHQANLTEGCLTARDASALLSYYSTLSHLFDLDEVENEVRVKPNDDLNVIMPYPEGDESNEHTVHNIATQKADACFSGLISNHGMPAYDVNEDKNNSVGEVGFLKDVTQMQALEYAAAHRLFSAACHAVSTSHGSVRWALEKKGDELLETFPMPDKILSSAIIPGGDQMSSIMHWLGEHFSFFKQEKYPEVNDLTNLTYVLHYARQALTATHQRERVEAIRRMDALRKNLPGYEKTHLKLSAYIGLMALAAILSILLVVPSGGTSLLLLGVGFLALTFKMSLATLAGMSYNVVKTSWDLWRETDEKGQARALGIFKKQVGEHGPDMDAEEEGTKSKSASFDVGPSDDGKFKKE
jgi:hypothetical protein